MSYKAEDMKEMERRQAWGHSSLVPGWFRWEGTVREPPNFVDSHGFETLPTYFCLGDTREMVSLAEPQFSSWQNGSDGTCPSSVGEFREVMWQASFAKK